LITENKNRTISVCLSPAMLSFYNLEDKIAVVIDIFRASSSICYGIHNGATAIIPVATVDDCLSYQDKGYLLAAERNGSVVEGFDFGNSPFSYTIEKIKDKTIVLTTTNGTRSIELSSKAKRVVLGSFLNLSALCKWLIEQKESIVLVCAGWKENFSLEDALFAGAVIEQLEDDFSTHDDGAIAALDLYKYAKADLPAYLKKSSHSERLKKLKIEKDIEFCLKLDILDSIPILKDGKLVKMDQSGVQLSEVKNRSSETVKSKTG